MDQTDMKSTAFDNAKHYRPAAWRNARGVGLPAGYRPLEELFRDPRRRAIEFESARDGRAVVDRSDRGLLVATGKDRASWLHNLVTNAVKTLAGGGGAYAFAIDVKGRIQFDLNILALTEELWLDIDRAALPEALKHLDRYLISEEVTLADASERFARIGVSGAGAREVVAALHAASSTAPTEAPSPAAATPGSSDRHSLVDGPQLAHRSLPGGGRIFRHDFAGAPGFELIVPIEAAAEWWDRLVQEFGCMPCGFDALDAARIEAAIPWPGRDLDEKVLPPETGTIERSISYNKGCYLGQEIIERMRSHGSLARRLVRLAMPFGPDEASTRIADRGMAIREKAAGDKNAAADARSSAADATSSAMAAGGPAAGDAVPSTDAAAPLETPFPLPATLRHDGKDVGRITSLARHPLRDEWIGLGYLKSAVTDSAGLTVGDPSRAVILRT